MLSRMLVSLLVSVTLLFSAYSDTRVKRAINPFLDSMGKRAVNPFLDSFGKRSSQYQPYFFHQKRFVHCTLTVWPANHSASAQFKPTTLSMERNVYEDKYVPRCSL
ncbi:hypothetical protein TELCIR_00320 [Teladorsagia circumcincta]|uniref:Uncharacterized protein n=1 Tax=Teladorsagia circumcincta TaxID=45464 RepID=A0A2G9V536_TELCI|nr:hypothetical protein TELCIR_00320 [Teladorsagia circumcincta]